MGTSSRTAPECRTRWEQKAKQTQRRDVNQSEWEPSQRVNDFKANRWAACEEMKEEQEVIAIFSDANEISVDAAVAVV